ncbi:MAG: lipoyl domain-containing protein [Desulfobacterales bacterium]|nr:lipoyl domain-containing protein [Desulfobacterales bacterium]
MGESVTEALLAQWFKKDGDTVRKDEPLFVLETDKVTLEVTAEAAGSAAHRGAGRHHGQDRGGGGRASTNGGAPPN